MATRQTTIDKEVILSEARRVLKMEGEAILFPAVKNWGGILDCCPVDSQLSRAFGGNGNRQDGGTLPTNWPQPLPVLELRLFSSIPRKVSTGTWGWSPVMT